MPLLQRANEAKDSPAKKQVSRDYHSLVITTSSISGLVKISQSHFAYNASKAACIVSSFKGQSSAQRPG